MKRLSCYMFYCLSSEEDIPRVWEIIITAHNKKEAGQIFQEYGKLKHNGRLVLIDITRIRKAESDESWYTENYYNQQIDYLNSLKKKLENEK